MTKWIMFARHASEVMQDAVLQGSLACVDIQEILDQKIKELPAGSHINGLEAVESHIDAAVRHL
jgi:hypothetical protein